MDETKFCTSCQAHRAVQGGVMRRGRKTSRWLCRACVEHKTDSIYRNTSGKTADVARIMRDLYRRAA